MVGFISLTPRPDNGLRSLGRIEDLAAGARRHRVAGGDHRRPGLPAGAGGRARRHVPPARRHRAHRAVDDGDPRPPRRVRARARRCRCSSCARRCSTASTTSLKRTFDFVVSRSLLLVLLSPLLLADRDRGRRLLARPGASTARSGPGIGGEPFACFKFRTMRTDADQMQADLESLNEALGRAVQDPRRPAADAGRPLPAPLLARRAAAAGQRAARRDVARRPAAAAAARLRAARGLAQEALPRAARASPACGRSPGRSELDFDDLVRLDFLYLERWSVGLDLTILLKTIPAVLSRRGAF